MHHIYHTAGFILGIRSHRESSKVFSIFTQELGMVEASAQAVREVKSKLRMNLNDFSFVDLSLLRGKQRWKITGAKERENFFKHFRHISEKLRVSANIFGLLSRFLHGEEKNQPLFSFLQDALVFFSNSNLEKEQIKNFEAIVVMRILHYLGYVGGESFSKNFLEDFYWGEEILSQAFRERQKIITE